MEKVIAGFSLKYGTKTGRLLYINDKRIMDAEMFGGDLENVDYIFHESIVIDLSLFILRDDEVAPENSIELGFCRSGYSAGNWRMPEMDTHPTRIRIIYIPFLFGVSLAGEYPELLFLTEADCQKAYRSGGFFDGSRHLPQDGLLPIMKFTAKKGSYVYGGQKQNRFVLANGDFLPCFSTSAQAKL